MVIGAEALLNGRPLAHVPVDPQKTEAFEAKSFPDGPLQPCLPAGPDVRTPGTIAQNLTRRSDRHLSLLVAPNLIERRKWVFKSHNI